MPRWRIDGGGEGGRVRRWRAPDLGGVGEDRGEHHAQPEGQQAPLTGMEPTFHLLSLPQVLSPSLGSGPIVHLAHWISASLEQLFIMWLPVGLYIFVPVRLDKR